MTDGVSPGRRLIRYALLVTLPLVVCGAALSWRNLETRRASVDADLAARVELEATDAERFISSRMAMLSTLGLAPSFRSGDVPAITALVWSADAEAIGFTGGLGWVASDGVLRAFSTDLGEGSPVSLADRSYVRAALDQGIPFVSETLPGRLMPTPLVAMSAPTRDVAGRVNGVLVGSIRLDRAAPGPQELRLNDPELLLVDRNDVLAIDGGRAIEPFRLDSEMLGSMRAEGLGVRVGTEDLLHRPGRTVAYATVPTAGWLLMTSTPTAAAYAAASRQFELEMAGLGGLALVAILGAERVARRMDRLALDEARSSAELRASEGRFRLLANSVPSFVWTAAPDGSITYASDRWLDYCGISSDENARDWPTRVLHPDDLDRCTEAWSRALREGTEYEIEVRNRRNDGEYRWFLTRATPVRDERGRITAWFGSTTDIHERKLLERAQQEFIAMAAHELKTPLTSLRGYAQLLQRGRSPERAVEVIVNQTHHLARLVDDLLEAAQLDAGRVELRPQRVDLVALVTRCVEHTRAMSDVHAITLITNQDTLVGMWDPDRLEQVIQNLLSNAVKYSPDGGQIHVTLTSRDDEVQLEVSDQGIGIPPDVQSRLFERFFRVKESTISIKGLGLGLYISRSFVEAHGGRIQVRSDGVGRGTRITVTLPIVPAELPLEQQDLAAASP